MPLVILTADVKNGGKWERAFRTHSDLFKTAGLGTMHYTVAEKDRVVICTDVSDVDAYLAFLKSDATREAMKHDGVKRKSVKVAVLDKQLAG
jgi:heme-degrading monooxygenase HmoA